MGRKEIIQKVFNAGEGAECGAEFVEKLETELKPELDKVRHMPIFEFLAKITVGDVLAFIGLLD